MNPQLTAERSYSDFVRGGEVHSSVLTSEEVFQAEMENIFQHAWVFVAHESEVPEPGDYCLKTVGGVELIVAHGDDGVIRIFFNRCRHRGSKVCSDTTGSANFFRCPFHGWTFKNTGELSGVPYPSRYENLDKATLGLDQVAAVDQYRGFVFARIKPGYEVTLTEHLGEAAGYIDNFVGASPTGRVSLRAGCQKGLYRGNWKYIGMDGYHPNFVHKSMLELLRRAGKEESASGRSNTDKSANRAWDLGNGHCRLDFSPTKNTDFGSVLNVGVSDEPVVADHIQRLIAAKGEHEALRAFEDGQDAHLHVWPNLQLISVHARVLTPISSGVTRVDVYPALLDGASDEFNARRLRAHEYFYGPIGFGQIDDYEVWERVQAGLTSDTWLVMTRGEAHETTFSETTSYGNITDEITQRGQMAAWIKMMDKTYRE